MNKRANMSNDHIFHRAAKSTWPRITHGKGVYLYDSQGTQYIDGCAGVHVVSIGHAVPEIVEAMCEQASKVSFTYGRFITQPQIDLADNIASRTPAGLSRVFFISGGSEATESAMKIARKYHLETGNPQKYRVISRWQSWHGNTIGAMSMSGRTGWREDYGPYVQNFPHIAPPIPYHCAYCRDRGGCMLDCADELERVIQQEGAQYIAAFIAEPILGTSAAGVTPHPDYYPRIREICDRYNVLMIMDEVVTGFGRTGVDFAIQHWGVTPDILCTGKGLSSGYTPIAATITHERIYDAIYQKAKSFVHGHTYGGNPLSCAIALSVQEYIQKHDLVARCAQMGEWMLARLKSFEQMPIVGEVRGKGLLLGIEFVADKATRRPFDPSLGVTARVVDKAFERGLLIMPGAPGLINGVAGDHIAISPPFTINEAQAQQVVDVLAASIHDVADEVG
jgi:adenosylmethionine-8-amino-7-oxononanoate aminotransferase